MQHQFWCNLGQNGFKGWTPGLVPCKWHIWCQIVRLNLLSFHYFRLEWHWIVKSDLDLLQTETRNFWRIPSSFQRRLKFGTKLIQPLLDHYFWKLCKPHLSRKKYNTKNFFHVEDWRYHSGSPDAENYPNTLSGLCVLLLKVRHYDNF